MLDGSGPLNGAKVVNLSPAVSEELGIEGPARGVMILDIARGSIAARTGFEKGDRVLSVNDTRIENTKGLVQANAAKQNLWKVTIQRGGQVLTQVFRF